MYLEKKNSTLSMPFFIQSFKPLLKYLVSQIRYCKGVRREPAKPREECWAKEIIEKEGESCINL